MQVSVENVGNLGRKLTVRMPAARLEDTGRNRVQEMGRSARLKGFRPGKVPTQVIEQRFGARIRGEALSELNMSKAFAPVLKTNGGGALLNVLSVASWVNGGELAAYSASKSAAWSLTNALRHELAAQKTQVLGLHMAYVDTDLTRGFDVQKTSAEEIVKRALDALEAGADEVLADVLTQQVRQGLAALRPSYLP